MAHDTDPVTTAREFSETITDAGAMLMDRSQSMSETTGGFAAFTDSTRGLNGSSAGTVAVADD